MALNLNLLRPLLLSALLLLLSSPLSPSNGNHRGYCDRLPHLLAAGRPPGEHIIRDSNASGK
jgi:hypothetical protein